MLDMPEALSIFREEQVVVRLETFANNMEKYQLLCQTTKSVAEIFCFVLTPTPKYTGVATSSSARAIPGLTFPNRAPAESAAADRSKFRREVAADELSSVARAFAEAVFFKTLYAFVPWINRHEERKRALQIFMVEVSSWYRQNKISGCN